MIRLRSLVTERLGGPPDVIAFGRHDHDKVIVRTMLDGRFAYETFAAQVPDPDLVEAVFDWAATRRPLGGNR